MAKLELQNLYKSYNRQVVPVKNVSLKIEDGEFLTLLGPSGCGKSTTLRLIAGLEHPTRGQIWIGDRNVTELGAGDRNIAMVFQSYALYPHMTVYDNMASSLKLRRTPNQEIQQRVYEVSEVLGLSSLLTRKPGHLSGGQRQRVALGRALVRRPEVFLLDEPLSNLDALLRERVRAELKHLFQQQNKPVVYVTHDQTEAMTLSSLVAVLHEGEVQQLDTPQQIYAYPANRFVAEFVGSPQMNLLTLPCQTQTVWLGQTRIPLPDGMIAPTKIILGIRPEQVGLTNNPDQLTPNELAVPGTIDMVENLGMHNLVTVKLNSSNHESISLRSLLPTDQHWKEPNVWLKLPLNSMHWFDILSGQRIAYNSMSAKAISSLP